MHCETKELAGQSRYAARISFCSYHCNITWDTHVCGNRDILIEAMIDVSVVQYGYVVYCIIYSLFGQIRS